MRPVVIAALAVAMAACGDSSRGPTAPTRSTVVIPPGGPPGVPPKPTTPSYMISGVITEYHRGSSSGARVIVFSCNRYWGIPCDTRTDQSGQYAIASPSADPTALGVTKGGYQTVWKERVSSEEPTASFVLHPAIPVSAFGSTVSQTVQGDEFMGGDDVLFGGLCVRSPCKVMEFSSFLGAPRNAEVRLRWPNARHELALYKFNGDPDIIDRDQPALRFCCSSEIVATISVGGYFDAIAVAFERASGERPAATDSEAFELTVRPIP